MSRTENGRILPNGGGANSASQSGRGAYRGLEVSTANDEELGSNEFLRSKTTLEGNYTKTLVFGGIDGVSLVCGLVFGGMGGNVTADEIAVIGITCLCAMAVNCGISVFLSSRAHRDFVQTEKRRGGWEFKNYRNDVMCAVEKRFEAKGMSKGDAKIVVGKMALYESVFINHMVSEDLGLQLPEDNDVHIIADTFMLVLSYAVFGFLPLSPLFFGARDNLSSEEVYPLTIILIFVLLGILGALKSSYSVVTWWNSAVETIVVGVVIAVVAFSTGKLLLYLL